MIWALIAQAVALVMLGIAAATPQGRRAFATLAATVAGWALFAAQHLAPDLAAQTAATLAKVLAATRPSLVAAAAVMLEELTGQAVDVPTLFDPQAGPFLGSTAVSSFDRVAGNIASVIAPPGDLTPAGGLKNLTGLFGLHLGTSLQAWGIDLAADMLSLGKLRSVAQFHAAIDAGLGFRRLGMLMWRAPVEEAITKPLRRYYAETYTFGIPSATEAITGYYSGTYQEDRVVSLLRSAGYDHSTAMELVDVAQRHLTPAEGAQAFRQGLIDETGLDALLRADKLGPDRAALVKALLTGEQAQRELAAIVTSARELYRLGDLDEDTYKQYLTQAHYTDGEIGLALTADQLALRKDKVLSKAELLEAMKRGVRTQEEVRAALRKQHYNDEDIDVLFALQLRQLDTSQIVAAFTRGEETQQAATAKLVHLGYSPGDAVTLLAAHARNLSEGQVVDALRRQAITADVARADLGKLGFDPGQVDLLVSFAQKELSAQDVQAALVRDLITPADAQARLEHLGYTPADAQLYVSLRVRLLTVGQILDGYGDAFFPRGQAVADLVQRGLSQAEALTVVAIFDRKAQEAQAKAAAKLAAAAAKAAGAPPTAPPAGGTVGAG